MVRLNDFGEGEVEPILNIKITMTIFRSFLFLVTHKQMNIILQEVNQLNMILFESIELCVFHFELNPI